MEALLFFVTAVLVMSVVFFCIRPRRTGGTHHPDFEPPPDPESLDSTRPDDIDTCHRCDGHGEIETPPSQTHGWTDPAYADVMTCAWCGGSGTEPGR